MKTDWRKYCVGSGIKCLEDTAEVQFENGRGQKVLVVEEDDAFLLRSVVARPAVVADLQDASLQAWERNRAVALVGFRVDDRGRMIGEAWLPKCGLTAAEFQSYLHAVAVECDRFEYQLTGHDVD